MSSVRRILLWGPPVVYMAAIFHFSSEPAPLPQVTAHVWDKLLHASEYGGLAALFARALAGEGLGWIAAAVLAVVLTSAYGVTDEYHQSFVPTRSSDLRDWSADTLGATLGALGFVRVAGRFSRASLRASFPHETS